MIKMILSKWASWANSGRGLWFPVISLEVALLSAPSEVTAAHEDMSKGQTAWRSQLWEGKEPCVH